VPAYLAGVKAAFT